MAAESPPVYRAESWTELQELLYRDSWREGIERHRAPYVYRGVSSENYRLETSLRRFVGDSGRWELESHLLRSFNKYAQGELDEPRSIWHLLSVAQHHGLPTRLFDWSYSPLVATYFATKSGRPDRDAAVWAVDYGRVHAALPDPYREVLEREGTNVFDVDLLASADAAWSRASDDVALTDREVEFAHRRMGLRLEETRRRLESISAEPEGRFVLFFEPPAINDRIVNQSALFSYQTDPDLLLDEWLEERPELHRKIVIPAECKPEFRDKLDQANVNPRTLFPGLDGLASWLAEYYRPRAPA
jgi:hypothetical protein